jgi:alpha-glucosidase
MEQRSAEALTFLLYLSEGKGEATFYEDAGEGYEHVDGHYGRRRIVCEVEGEHIRVTLSEREGSFVPARQHIRFEVHNINFDPKIVLTGGDPASWSYDPERRSIVVEVSEEASSQVIQLS